MAMWNKQPMALSIAACLYANNGCVRYNVVFVHGRVNMRIIKTRYTSLHWNGKNVMLSLDPIALHEGSKHIL